jgi:hypothetical protein
MKSQLEKFEAKYAKLKTDLHAINQENLKRQREEEIRNAGIKNVEAMKKAGNIEEAAAVFSHTGLEILVNMLVNSLETRIKEQLPALVEATVKDQMMSLLTGLMKGLFMNTTENEEQEAPKKELSIDEFIRSVYHEAEPGFIPNDIPKEEQEKVPVYDTKKEAEIVKEKLKEIGTEIRLRDLVAQLPEINWGVNATNKMVKLMKHEPAIKKSELFGMYYYDNNASEE